tara:strand:+ start:56 stop:631 length:576 start_codon:yes stop_codon:yes gene_type:complete
MVSNFIYQDLGTYNTNNMQDGTYEEATKRCESKCRDNKDSGEFRRPPCNYYNVARGTNVDNNPDKIGNFQGVVEGDDNYYKCFMTESTDTMCGAQTGDYKKLCNNIFDKSEGAECWKDMNNNCIKLTSHNPTLMLRQPSQQPETGVWDGSRSRRGSSRGSRSRRGSSRDRRGSRDRRRKKSKRGSRDNAKR